VGATSDSSNDARSEGTHRRGTVFIVSAPSGAGKSSILARALARDRGLCYSVSATTRPPRNGEIDGTHYRFVDETAFRRWIDEDRFAEWAKVHDNYYGTLNDDVTALLDSGKDVILEIDVQGARTIRGNWQHENRGGVKSIFIAPPSLEELERRLKKRGDLTGAALAARLKNAEVELAAQNEYDHVILNEDLDDAVAEFELVVQQTRAARA
jgi:guanylate kinase